MSIKSSQPLTQDEVMRFKKIINSNTNPNRVNSYHPHTNHLSHPFIMSVRTGPDGHPEWVLPNGTFYIAGGSDVNCTISVCPVELSVYGYRPSLPLSILLIVLYGLCMVAQTFMGWRYKTWGFMTAMLFGCIVEILGYVGRIMMWNNPWNHSGFIMQIVLITIGPVFFSAAIYVMLYQIARYISPESSRFRPTLFYWIFIPCDIISLILQAIGGAQSASSDTGSQSGVDIALAGLGFQVATLTIFSIAVCDYMFLSRHVWRTVRVPGKFKIFFAFLTAATILILIRCCYRVYELSEGYSRTSSALRDQPLFIALEAVMVITAAWCLVAGHPGPVFYTGDRTVSETYKEKMGMTEAKHDITSDISSPESA